MNRASKVISTSVLASSIITTSLLAALPVNSLALGSTTKGTFCTELSSKVGNFTTQITNMSNKLTQAWTQQDQNLEAH